MGDSFAAERIGNLTAERICELLEDACSEWGVSSISEGMVTLTARDLDRMIRDAETRGRLAGLREAHELCVTRVTALTVAQAIRKLIEETENG